MLEARGAARFSSDRFDLERPNFRPSLLSSKAIDWRFSGSGEAGDLETSAPVEALGVVEVELRGEADL